MFFSQCQVITSDLSGHLVLAASLLAFLQSVLGRWEGDGEKRLGKWGKKTMECDVMGKRWEKMIFCRK
jgi:hypothetical protein